MSKVVRVAEGNYKVVVDNGTNGTITLDTTAGSATPRGTTVITGNLEVRGTTTTVESTVTTIADNIITLNDGESGLGVRASFDYKAGIEIDRGSYPFARMVWDESVPYVAGGNSGNGAFRFEDQNEDFLPISVNSINAQGPLYVTTPNSGINVAGTVDYEENVYNYNAGVIEAPAILNDDLIPNAKGVADYVTFALANNLQSGVGDADTKIVAEDFDSSGVDSLVKVEIDGTITARFLLNRVEIEDVAIQGNSISTVNTNEQLVLEAQGTGSIVAKDAFEITKSLYADDVADPGDTNPGSGVKLYSKDEAGGDTGLYFVNEDGTKDEFISRNRALVFGMLF